MTRYGKQSKAERVEIMGADIARSVGGQYVLNATSGLLTLIAAGTATAGHVCAFRNGSATLKVQIDRIRVRQWITTAPTAQQEFSLNLIMARSYTAAHTGGTAVTMTTSNGKKNVDHAVISTDLDFRIGATAALTAGTHTLDGQAFATAGKVCLAAGATVQIDDFELDYAPPPGGGKLILGQDEGFVLRNGILGGTAGVWRNSVTLDFQILDATDAFFQ